MDLFVRMLHDNIYIHMVSLQYVFSYVLSKSKSDKILYCRTHKYDSYHLKINQIDTNAFKSEMTYLNVF